MDETASKVPVKEEKAPERSTVADMASVRKPAS